MPATNPKAPSNDATLIRGKLEEVEQSSTTLKWASERPWNRQSHVWLESGLPVVDLHDLNMRLARKAVRATLEVADELRCGAVCFVTGRGRHSMGPPALKGMVAAELRRACEENPEWSQRAGHAGRWMWIIDPKRAPRVATGQLGPAFWIGILLFIALSIWALLGFPGHQD